MTYLIIGLVIIVIIIVVINKIKNKNYISVSGKIIKYVEEDGKHYPVFCFTTVEGKTIENRCYIKVFNEIADSSVESAYGEEYAKKFLEEPLPIENISIMYKKTNPEEFIAKWI